MLKYSRSTEEFPQEKALLVSRKWLAGMDERFSPRGRTKRNNPEGTYDVFTAVEDVKKLYSKVTAQGVPERWTARKCCEHTESESLQGDATSFVSADRAWVRVPQSALMSLAELEHRKHALLHEALSLPAPRVQLDVEECEESQCCSRVI